jgi:hypothetical protein
MVPARAAGEQAYHVITGGVTTLGVSKITACGALELLVRAFG